MERSLRRAPVELDHLGRVVIVSLKLGAPASRNVPVDRTPRKKFKQFESSHTDCQTVCNAQSNCKLFGNQYDYTESLQPLLTGVVTTKLVVTTQGGVVTTPISPSFGVTTLTTGSLPPHRAAALSHSSDL